MKLVVNDGTGSKFLNASRYKELGLKRKPMTIKGFETVKFKDGKEKEAMSVDQITDKLVLNSTNKKILIRAYGDDTDKMIGKTIYLNLMPSTYNGQTVESIVVDTE